MIKLLLVTHFCNYKKIDKPFCKLNPQGRILVKTGISLELPKYYSYPKYLDFPDEISDRYKQNFWWIYEDDLTLNKYKEEHKLLKYAVADIRPRSGLALKHGITVLNTLEQ